jgi:hypothetical protein
MEPVLYQIEILKLEKMMNLDYIDRILSLIVIINQFSFIEDGISILLL